MRRLKSRPEIFTGAGPSGLLVNMSRATLLACRSFGFRILTRPIQHNFVFRQTSRLSFTDAATNSPIRFFSSPAAEKEKPADTKPETSGSTGENNNIQPFEYTPSVTETVKILRKLAQVGGNKFSIFCCENNLVRSLYCEWATEA
jgi:hypothetical protein